MAYREGSFVWYTLFTKVRENAKVFYPKVVGWSAESMPMPGGDYTLFKTGTVGRGGISPVDVPAPSHWASYLAVDDVDAKAKAVVAAGGRLLAGPDDIPTVGRYAAVTDPQGAMFMLFTSASADDQAPPKGPGAFHWVELWAKDVDAVLPFYKEVFGYTTEVMPSDSGAYYILLKDGEPQAGALTAPHKDAPPMWLPWIHVVNVDEASQMAKYRGGKILFEPKDVPGVGRICIIEDNTSAVVGLITPAAPPAS